MKPLRAHPDALARAAAAASLPRVTPAVPPIPVLCHDCGSVARVPGLWAFVPRKLLDQDLSAKLEPCLRLYLRCPRCGSISYDAPLDRMASVVEYFQCVVNPGSRGVDVQMIPYDLGNWEALVEHFGFDEPSTLIESAGGGAERAMPGSDLTCGVCAPQGLLPLHDVVQAIHAACIERG